MISNLRPSRAVIVRSRYLPATLGDVDDRRCRATTIGGDPDEVTANTSIVCMSTFLARRPSRQRRRDLTSSPLATVGGDENGATGISRARTRGATCLRKEQNPRND